MGAVSTRHWSLYRHIKHIIEYQKALVLLFILAILSRWYVTTYPPHSRSSNNQETSFQQSLEKATQKNEKIANPSMVQLMMERYQVFKSRKELADSICKNLTTDNPLYKPRDGTIYFDILWDPHYQVCKSMAFLN